MNFDLPERTILLTLAGSHAYGINRPDSDIDCKGVAVPPKEYYFGVLHTFEQADKPSHMANFLSRFTSDEQAVIAKTKLEGTVYEIRKFLGLAMDANPNILDVLFCRDEDIRLNTLLGKMLRDNRQHFVSAKAKHTFSGYAAAQLKRIETHRRWLLNPVEDEPSRIAYGLPPRTLIPADQLAAAQSQIQKKLDSWEFDFNMLPESDRIHISTQITEYLGEILSTTDAKWKCAARTLGYDTNFIELLDRERRYKAAHTEWEHYQHWKKSRNVDRAALEAEHGYDTKHGAHLYRLMKMCREILTTGEVRVHRGGIDADEIKQIRTGSWPYDKLVTWAKQEDAELQAMYVAKQYSIPREPNRKKIHELGIEIIDLAMKDPEKAFAPL